MAYKPFIDVPEKPRPPLKSIYVHYEIYHDGCSLKDALTELSNKAGLYFDETDYGNIYIGENIFSYEKTIENKDYDKQMKNYQKYLKQYERDLTKYNKLTKIIEEFNKEKKK